jgi:hypothetical protein
MAILGSGCVSVVSHIDEYDAGVAPKPTDGSSEAEVNTGGPCASGVHWNNAMPPTDKMNPGVPCWGAAGCHTPSSKTVLTAAGTIYPINGQHDENNCNGLDSTMVGAAIGILDPDTMAEVGTRLVMNSAGNFYTTRPMPAKYLVRLFSNGKTVDMIAPVTDGNCNYCHSAEGLSMAKGRMIPPPVN